MIPDAWGAARGLPVVVAPDAGLINSTFLLGEPPSFVLQRVNPIFTPAVQVDIEAVTGHLARGGLVTPRIVPTDSGGLHALAEDGAVWRLLTFVPGRTLHRVTSPDVAEEAARCVARFHAALLDFTWDYQNVRHGVHDTPAHMARLEAAVRPGEGEALAHDILAFWRTWQGRAEGPAGHAHGDLKISNVRFSAALKAVCLVDLDTLGLLPLDVELGDALRSWCNPVGEESLDTMFNLDIFAAAVRGYTEVRPLDREERRALVGGTERIATELAARFCRDAFEDCYFGWDDRRFPTRVAHNLFRARGQLALARSVRSQRVTAERAIVG